MVETLRKYNAFTVPGRGLFQFWGIHFGFNNAPETRQRLIDTVLGLDLEPNVFVYLDDMVILTQTLERNLQVLLDVFRRLREAILTVSIEHCQFCRPEMTYLGYRVDRNDIYVVPSKVKAMIALPVPRKKKNRFYVAFPK